MKKKLDWVLWVVLGIIVIYMFTRYREGFATVRPMLTNDDIKTFNVSSPIKTTPNTKIFLDFLKTKIPENWDQSEIFYKNFITHIFQNTFKNDITPLVKMIDSFSTKPSPSEFVDKLHELLSSLYPGSIGDKKMFVDAFNAGIHFPNGLPNPLYLSYEYLYGPTTEKATIVEKKSEPVQEKKKPAEDPKPARVSPMARTNLTSGYEAHPYSEFPKCNPNFRAIPGGTIEEKCFS